MTLAQYVALLRRSWQIVLASLVLGLLVAVVYLVITPARYTAVAKSFVSTSAGQDLADLNQGSTFAQQSAQSYAEVAVTPFVLASVAQDLGDGETVSALARQVTATSSGDSVIITISATDPSPSRAARIANSTADHLSSAVDQLAPDITNSASAVRITAVQSATPPAFRSSPSVGLTLAVGLLVGLVAGLTVVMVRRSVDTRFKSADDLRRLTDRPVLGVIGLASGLAEEPVFMHAERHKTLAEGMRGVRTNLRFTRVPGRAPVTTITSSLPSEGKSTSAINLAVAIADAGEKVLLVEADLRRPSIAGYLALDGEVGLTDVLIDAVTLDQAVQRWGDRDLWVLPAGRVPPNPNELLQSPPMTAVIDQAVARGWTVLIDAPPLLSVSDALILAAASSGVLVVAAAKRVRGAQLRASFAALDHVHAHVLGVLATRVPLGRRDGAGYYGYYGRLQGEEVLA